LFALSQKRIGIETKHGPFVNALSLLRRTCVARRREIALWHWDDTISLDPNKASRAAITQHKHISYLSTSQLPTIYFALILITY